jgi:tryptophan halogenase
MDFVGIDHLELLHETRATVKIGILFKDWHSGPDYVHSISAFEQSSLNRPDLFHHLYLNGKQENFPLAPHFKPIFLNNLVDYHQSLKTSNQYHFDTFKLGEYLLKICIQRGIEVIDGIVTDVRLNNAGEVKELVTKEKDILGDLFIDCSGFKRVLSSKLGNKWVSKTDYLPLNRAIAFPAEFSNPDSIEPYTTSTALSAGWSWRIPTQDRYGNGYVFNNNYIDSDKALAEISQSLGLNIEKFARDIPFEAGKVDKFWLKNVISVGLSGSFAEPLEAQSIGFAIIQSRAIIDYIEVWPHNKNISDRFNKDMDSIFENIIDYLQLHYLGDRCDSKFWQERPFKITDFNKENLPLFEKGLFIPSLYKPEHMFKVANFYQVAAGLNLVNKDAVLDSLNFNRQTYNEIQYNSAIKVLQSVKSRPVINHRQFLNLVSFNYIHKEGFNES